MISIVREGDQLKGEISAGSRQTLMSTGEHEFVVAESDGRVVFGKIESGKAAQYTLETGEEKRVYQRIDPADEAPLKLEDYTGNYRSKELELNCTIELKAGRLFMQHRRHGEMALRQNSRDRFSVSSIGAIRFDRDADGKVTGFMVTTGRVRNLRFNRQPS